MRRSVCSVCLVLAAAAWLAAAVGVFPTGLALAEITLGALFSVVGAVATLGVAWLLQVGRFARRRSDLEHRHGVRPRHAHA